ncbi:ABC transporter substrate-binding protein [Paenibacillus anseongense]|uniref:ABC transporter substrate-binding protein n=1 Tax=Paenibacillus TaxID=44249 RepID=UPI002DB5BDB9|nr:extracellular solute-binding protein [Paenibacillus anseongense]MEC0270301.1 extracellular solute-binding protein [Paenibacillus anseongense]
MNRTHKLNLLIAAVLLVTLLFTIYSRRDAPNVSQSPPAAPSVSSAPVKITFWNVETNDLRQALLNQSIQAFNQTHKAVQIVPYFYEVETYKAKLKLSMISGKMPDLFYYWTGESFKYMVDSQIIADLTEKMQERPAFMKQFYPEALQYATYYDRLYGLPHTTSHVVFWYNKRIFAQYGIMPPQTWDELMSAAQQLLNNGIPPFTVSGKERWPLLNWFAYLSNRMGGSTPFQHAIKKTGDFTDPAFLEGAQLFRGLITAKMFVPGFLGLDGPKAEDILLKGEAAMYLQGDWVAEKMLSNPDIGYFRFPTVHGKGDPQVYYGGYSSGWAISANSNRDAAFEVLSSMLGMEERKKVVEASGLLSTAKDMPLDRNIMNPLVYDFVTFIEKDPVDFFGYYDQEIDPHRSQLLLNAVVTMASAPTMSQEEIEDLLKQIR